ncbi:hypothetical protein [uncultured Kordia sp.]|uniref:hypothetical protein n=1 Tax=uncultured Kordia sp. TaxID=507699 RepID=UPI002616C0C9|nr:hypothetical protein [uncultured Kordia sp.]
MKKRKLKSLILNKRSISNLDAMSFNGGREASIHETNCDYCPVNPAPDEPNDPVEPDGPRISVNNFTCTTLQTLKSRLLLLC